ncbi:uncharacterized protein ColSpa_11045 [Colletotrichum spaethianum]|uniref:Uncharacterized protein n=1 Tax=Colletotrichum spaethianum TaxID=700344 RepID=A0AA37UK73_9PEZI|nr:uncharacterized protein ColSpa_11045 [Colletotrichum spaethianum]GKT50864.1 hypothetical protein ColSpa_11045 [Colletotrichum spaethianum]
MAWAVDIQGFKDTVNATRLKRPRPSRSIHQNRQKHHNQRPPSTTAGTLHSTSYPLQTKTPRQRLTHSPPQHLSPLPHAPVGPQQPPSTQTPLQSLLPLEQHMPTRASTQWKPSAQHPGPQQGIDVGQQFQLRGRWQATLLKQSVYGGQVVLWGGGH